MPILDTLPVSPSSQSGAGQGSSSRPAPGSGPSGRSEQSGEHGGFSQLYVSTAGSGSQSKRHSGEATAASRDTPTGEDLPPGSQNLPTPVSTEPHAQESPLEITEDPSARPEVPVLADESPRPAQLLSDVLFSGAAPDKNAVASPDAALAGQLPGPSNGELGGAVKGPLNGGLRGDWKGELMSGSHFSSHADSLSGSPGADQLSATPGNGWADLVFLPAGSGLNLGQGEVPVMPAGIGETPFRNQGGLSPLSVEAALQGVQEQLSGIFQSLSTRDAQVNGAASASRGWAAGGETLRGTAWGGTALEGLSLQPNSLSSQNPLQDYSESLMVASRSDLTSVKVALASAATGLDGRLDSASTARTDTAVVQRSGRNELAGGINGSAFDSFDSTTLTSSPGSLASAASPGTAAGMAQSSGLQAQSLAHSFSQPQWSESFSRHIALMAGRNGGSAQIQLDPPELGALTVKVSINGDQASVSFVSQVGTVRDAVEQSLPRLEELLGEQGLNLLSADVSDQSETGRNDQQNPDETDMPTGQAETESARMERHFADVGLIDYYA